MPDAGRQFNCTLGGQLGQCRSHAARGRLHCGVRAVERKRVSGKAIALSTAAVRRGSQGGKRSSYPQYEQGEGCARTILFCQGSPSISTKTFLTNLPGV